MGHRPPPPAQRASAPVCCPRLEMSEVPVARVWLVLFLLTVQVGVTAGAPWQCAPCSPEKLALCPPVPASCSEVTRSAGCGCCPMCALPLGAACGVATARCARGLSCRALPGEQQPLHALTRGQGACVQESDASAPNTEAAEAGSPESPESTEITEEELLDNFHLMAPSEEDHSILWDAISTYDGSKALHVTNIKKWKEPCRIELYRVVESLSKAQETSGEEISKFYLPNCNKNGFYHSRQCETSLAGEERLCWCVYPWNGKRIPGSPEIRGDPNCQTYFNVQN
ncbi:insulin-like growth factor-binding protein 1 [Rhinopithecus roxellana]|nr:insulin-like growth factor-binding protein 1 [Rhinopithecus roxellana]XP_017735799.1 PREDICTED: insulin-like growth factor-binding protein 1 [Rhinopithecus bieti]